MNNWAIIKRNGIFFYIYMIFFATRNILPQFFLLSYCPDNKETLLMVLLILSTLASISGIELSNRFIHFPNLSLRTFVRVLALSCGLLLSALFLVRTLFIYFSIFIVLKLIANYLFNILDTHCVYGSNETTLAAHVKVNSAQQLLAIVLISLFLGFFYRRSLQNSIFFFLLIIILFCLAYPYLDIPRILKEHHNRKLNIPPEHKYYLLVCASVFSAFGVFSSLLVFLIHNYYHFSDSQKTTGLLLTISCLSGAAAIIVFSKKIKSKSNDVLFLILLINFIAIILFWAKLDTSFGFVAVLSGVTGGTYGLFMVITRHWISVASGDINNYRLLAIYNNLPNLSILFGFGLSLGVVKITQVLNIAYYPTMLIVVALFFPAGAFCLSKSNKSKKLKLVGALK